MTTTSMSTLEALGVAPINAWLLIGDAKSYPTPGELKQMRRKRRPTDVWTAPSQARAGDLLLFYFMAPVKEIRFAARASSNPFFNSALGVNAERAVDPHQWWITHTPLHEVPPISFNELSEALGGHLVLKGKPRHYLPPAVIEHLATAMAERNGGAGLDAALAQVLQTPVGDPDLPDPATVSLDSWTRMADGALKLERQVEQYVVEPLLRMALTAEVGLEWKQAYRIPGAGIADYAILRDGVPTGVVEVKLGIAEPGNARWADSSEFAQVKRYMDRLQVPGMLVDSRRAHLIHLGASAPTRSIDRITGTAQDLTAIARHLAP